MKIVLLFELTFSVLLICSNFAIAEITNDSINYLNIREQVLLNDATDQTVPTSDALFEAGLFTEAISLLQECALLKPSDSISSRQYNKNVQWQISSGADYFHLNDFDTVAMTSEELREHNRLTETPLSIWLKAKVSIKPESTLIKEITPEIYISERKNRLETTAFFYYPSNFCESNHLSKLKSGYVQMRLENHHLNLENHNHPIWVVQIYC